MQSLKIIIDGEPVIISFTSLKHGLKVAQHLQKLNIQIKEIDKQQSQYIEKLTAYEIQQPLYQSSQCDLSAHDMRIQIPTQQPIRQLIGTIQFPYQTYVEQRQFVAQQPIRPTPVLQTNTVSPGVLSTHQQNIPQLPTVSARAIDQHKLQIHPILPVQQLGSANFQQTIVIILKHIFEKDDWIRKQSYTQAGLDKRPDNEETFNLLLTATTQKLINQPVSETCSSMLEFKLLTKEMHDRLVYFREYCSSSKAIFEAQRIAAPNQTSVYQRQVNTVPKQFLRYFDQNNEKIDQYQTVQLMMEKMQPDLFSKILREAPAIYDIAFETFSNIKFDQDEDEENEHKNCITLQQIKQFYQKKLIGTYLKLKQKKPNSAINNIISTNININEIDSIMNSELQIQQNVIEQDNCIYFKNRNTKKLLNFHYNYTQSENTLLCILVFEQLFMNKYQNNEKVNKFADLKSEMLSRHYIFLYNTIYHKINNMHKQTKQINEYSDSQSNQIVDKKQQIRQKQQTTNITNISSNTTNHDDSQRQNTTMRSMDDIQRAYIGVLKTIQKPDLINILLMMLGLGARCVSYIGCLKYVQQNIKKLYSLFQFSIQERHFFIIFGTCLKNFQQLLAQTPKLSSGQRKQQYKLPNDNSPENQSIMQDYQTFKSKYLIQISSINNKTYKEIDTNVYYLNSNEMEHSIFGFDFNIYEDRILNNDQIRNTIQQLSLNTSMCQQEQMKYQASGKAAKQTLQNMNIVGESVNFNQQATNQNNLIFQQQSKSNEVKQESQISLQNQQKSAVIEMPKRRGRKPKAFLEQQKQIEQNNNEIDIKEQIKQQVNQHLKREFDDSSSSE